MRFSSWQWPTHQFRCMHLVRFVSTPAQWPGGYSTRDLLVGLLDVVQSGSIGAGDALVRIFVRSTFRQEAATPDHNTHLGTQRQYSQSRIVFGDRQWRVTQYDVAQAHAFIVEFK